MPFLLQSEVYLDFKLRYNINMQGYSIKGDYNMGKLRQSDKEIMKSFHKATKKADKVVSKALTGKTKRKKSKIEKALDFLTK